MNAARFCHGCLRGWIVLLAGCGGSSMYEAAVAPDPSAPQATSAEASPSAAPAAPAPAGDAAESPAADSAGPAASPQSGGESPWSSRPLPEVAPYEDPAEKNPSSSSGESLPSGFFDPPDTTAPAPRGGAAAGSAPAVPGSGSPAAGGTPSAPFISPSAGAGQRTGPPGVPRANNPYGFPTGSDPAGPAVSAPQGVAPTGEGLPQLRLHGGVALAQTLPTGTAMGFQVQYTFNGDYDPSGRYAWVIKPPRGPAVAMAVQLKQRGSLSTFVTQWGPVTGTYEMQIQMLDPASGRPRAICRPHKAVYAR